MNYFKVSPSIEWELLSPNNPDTQKKINKKLKEIFDSNLTLGSRHSHLLCVSSKPGGTNKLNFLWLRSLPAII